MDPISPSFCAAKWYNATIWLNSGTTASCHHPPPHAIDVRSLGKNPSALHNTPEKKKARAQMLRGIRPSECEYCWKIEDLGKQHISDRVFKTVIYEDQEINQLARLPAEADANPRTLEIAFDRTCQFACMYCSPSFSSRWVQDIAQRGPYLNLPTDRRQHYVSTHDWAQAKVDSPYLSAFWKWWPDLRGSLQQLRITGGEPLMSPHFWKLMSSLHDSTGEREPVPPQIAVNSNLGVSTEVIERLIAAAAFVPRFEVYTSGEAFGAVGEYIRDGLNWEHWVRNMETLMSSATIRRMHVMMTVNIMCLYSLTDFLEKILDWKEKFGFENPTLSFNILRFPTFLSPLVLPLGLRKKIAGDLRSWLTRSEERGLLIDFERQSLLRLLEYLESAESPTEGAASPEMLARDLKSYLLQYDRRRGKNFRTVMPPEFTDWISALGETP